MNQGRVRKSNINEKNCAFLSDDSDDFDYDEYETLIKCKQKSN